MPSPFQTVARATRNGHPESWHHGAAAAVTPQGELIGRVGDHELPVFMRSAAKPFQALPLVLAGGEEAFGLDDADLALVCASHAGTPEHVERAASLLERSGHGTDALHCGTHRPFDRDSSRRLYEAGEAPSVLHNNCSGKHVGMLMACRLLDLPADDYSAPEHPLQRRIVEELRRFTALGLDCCAHGVDGCGVPTYLVSLAAAARAYAALAAPALAGLDGERASAATRIVEAMVAEPRMVAGPGRFTTRLMEVTGGRVLGKEGAEGYYAAAVRGPVALGVTLKIAGGDLVCRDGVVLDLLRQLGVLSAAELEELAGFHRVPIKSHRGLVVGELAPEVELREAAATL